MKKILIIASLFCLLACQHKQENKIEKINCRTIAVDSLSDLPEQKIKQIRYIPLETNDNILFGDSYTAHYVNNQLYISTSQKVLVFDKKGKFVYGIDKVGQGPGEYTSIWDIDITQQGDVYIADGTSGKIIKYMSQGSRYEEYMTGEQFLNFVALNDSVFYLANVFKDGQMDIALAKYSPVSKELVALSTYDGLFENGSIYRYGTSFYRAGNSLYYYKLFSSELSEVTERGLDCSLNFPSDNWVTKDVLRRWSKDRKASYSEGRELLRGINAYCETAEYVYISIYRMPLSIELLVNKVTGELMKPIFFSGQIRSYRSSSGDAATDSCFIAFTSPETENISHILEHDSNILPEDREALSNLLEDDNPILLLLKF